MISLSPKLARMPIKRVTGGLDLGVEYECSIQFAMPCRGFLYRLLVVFCDSRIEENRIVSKAHTRHIG